MQVGDVTIQQIYSAYSVNPDTGMENSTGIAKNRQTPQPHSETITKQDTDTRTSKDKTQKTSNDQKLTESEKEEVRKLKKRDQKVRAHEQAHMAAGAGLIRGGAHYEFQRGPDGRLYAVGGDVTIDTSEESTPEATLQKMIRVKAAALAPVDPSPQDRKIAAMASAKAAKARSEIALENTEMVRDKEDAQGPYGRNGRSNAVKNPTGNQIDLVA